MAEKREQTSSVDFTVLDGVGSKTAKALTAAGFASMKQLAKAHVVDLVERLDQVGSPVPASRVISQRWLFQAWELAAPPTPSMQPTQEPEHKPAEPLSGDVSDDWTEQATFIICFDRRGRGAEQQWQTRVWDTKAMAEAVFDGTEPATWSSFVASQAELAD